MYGSFKYDSIQAGHEYAANQQYSNKDDYSIKNTLQYAKPELAALNASSANRHPNDTDGRPISQPLQAPISSADQWPMNSYYDQSSSYSSSTLLTPDSPHSNLSVCNVSNVSLQTPSQLQSPNVQTNLPAIQQNIQSNVQLNIQLNVQSNLHPATIDSNHVPSSLATSIRQSVHQFNHQLPDQLAGSQLANRLAPQQMQSPSKSNPFNSTAFGEDHYKDLDLAPPAKKIKNEKTPNFNYNQQTGYFHNSPNQLRQQPGNQMQAVDFHCNLPYQQVGATGNGFVNSIANTHDGNADAMNDLPSDYYSTRQSNMGNAIEPPSYHQQQPMKSDQPDYAVLNDTNDSNVHHKKPLSQSKQPSACMPNLATLQPMQSSAQQPSMDRSLNSSSNNNSYPTNPPLDSSYSYLQSANLNVSIDMNPSSLPAQNCNQFNESGNSLSGSGSNSHPNSHPNSLPHNQPNFGQQPAIRHPAQNRQTSNFNSIRCPKQQEMKRLFIKQELKATIQSRMQYQSQIAVRDRFNSEHSASSKNSHKLVDRKEVPNCKLTNSKTNHSRTSKSVGVILDEEEKRRRRRERNKVAATKCRNKKKAHVYQLSERGASLDIENKLLRNELTTLRLEEQQLVQLLLSHKRVCNLRVTMITHQPEQLYQSDNPGGGFPGAPLSTDFGQQTFPQQSMPAEIVQFKNNRIKIESDYEQKVDNAIQVNNTNNPNGSLNNQQYSYPPIFNQPSPIIKIEDNYNYPPNYSDHRLAGDAGQVNYQQCFNQPIQPPSYQAVSSPQVNYDFTQNSTHYGDPGSNLQSVNKLSNNESPGLASGDFMQCTNDTPGDNGVFLNC